MTDTLISLMSIFIGILGANIFGYFLQKGSYDIISNTIAGVFGSILIIKLFGRLGFDPTSIVLSGAVDYRLFIMNSVMSGIGGIMAVSLIYRLKKTTRASPSDRG